MSGNNPRTRGIVVLGMHRSGTSLTASLIHKWGAFSGEQRHLIAGDEWNRPGYWEYLPLVRFNMDLLASVDSRTMIPPGEKQRDRLRALAAAPKYRRRALGLLRSMQVRNRPWIWKDPRLSILLPFWEKLWGDVIYVIAVRHPVEVAVSLHRREPRLSCAAALVVWQRHMTEILRTTKSRPSKIFVDYNRLIASPSASLKDLYSFLDRESGKGNRDGSRILSDDFATKVNLSLYHNRQKESVCETTAAQRRLYALLRDLASKKRKRVPDVPLAPATRWRPYLFRAAKACIDFKEQAD